MSKEMRETQWKKSEPSPQRAYSELGDGRVQGKTASWSGTDARVAEQRKSDECELVF